MFRKLLTLGAFLLVTQTYSVNVTAAIEKNTKTQTHTIQSDERVVYGVSVSPYVRKVKVMLNEKKLPFKQSEVLPLIGLKATNSEIPDDFTKASPLGKIPAYSEKDWSIADSGVIGDYLEAQYPAIKLLPSDPRERARAKWFEKYGDETLANVIHTKIFIERVVKPLVFKQQTDESVVQKAISEELPPLFDYLEKEVGDKQFIAGNLFSIADIAIVTHFVSLEKSNVKLDAQKWPKLAAYVQRIIKRDSFQKAL
ncbi:MAG: glutathione S-transferase family protein [Alphaproteobacteria bacterium]|nr:glutathione S-transferase family protein [Alphaproteobacteria bacterium]